MQEPLQYVIYQNIFYFFIFFFKLIQLVVFNNTLSQAKTKRLVELDVQKSLVLITLILHFVL